MPLDALVPAVIAALFVLILLSRLRPRKVFLVRHGQTLLNAQHIRQGPEGGLSESGKAQAEIVGKYLRRFHIKCILSSPYERTRQTSEIIDKQLHVPIFYSPLFAERRNPTEVVGKHRDDPAVVKIIDQIDLAYHADDYRYSDEENFTDLKLRARKSLSLLARQGERNTAVVTHHVFLKVFLAYLLYRERLHASDFAKLAFFNFLDNATVTIVEYRPWLFLSKTRGWRVVSFNEQPT